ncbi:MAG: NHLP family bacteriocin export ABC transporter peptidase/permease/ATPase subunit [Oscillospiraceae bacterium]|nr:NHLP family bacteriocin export ABC transporter peptidase/permease/ATPase subunit [Oscillospiraceae bacterium]
MTEKKYKIKTPVTAGIAKVPVIMQLEALECGAASLAMVMAYYDKWVPLEQIRADCGVSRDGSNAKNIYIAAQNYGFKVEAFRRSPEKIIKEGVFPCIIHWNFNHFVVLDGFRGKYAYINDPAKGFVRVTMSEFDRAFTGVTLNITPGEGYVPSGKRKSIVESARKRLSGAGAELTFVILASIISALFGLINPVMSKVFLDRIISGTNPGWLDGFIYVLGGLAVLQIAAAWVQTVYSLKINGKMAVIGSSTYMWKVLRMPMEFFSQRMAGDIEQRQETNAEIAGTLLNTLAPLVINTFMMIFYLSVMIRYSLLLTAAGISAIILNLIMSQIISEKRMNITRIQMRDSGKLAGTTVAGIEMIETIKAGGAENGFFRRWAGYQASVNTQTVKYARVQQYLGAVPQFIDKVSNYAVLILGVWLCMQGKFTLGGVMAFQGFMNSFLSPAMTLIEAGQMIQEMRTNMERVDDVMEYPSDSNVVSCISADGQELNKLSGNVELKNITFGYSRLEEPLIKDFSMTLKTGSRVAFVGMSGCGKSTLSKLISGLYDPWEGEILFDGKHRSEIPRSVMTGSVAVVDQDIILFEDTIANNIRMWDDSIMDFEVILAARDAQLHDDIMQREGGYEYRIASGGRDLSGGQRQRMEIARVLAQDPSILILDEATSALDAKTEYDVIKAIKDRGITCIVIAHRLSTIRDCDEIIVLDHGRVAERGTHDELMAKGGVYTELVVSE